MCHGNEHRRDVQIALSESDCAGVGTLGVGVQCSLVPCVCVCVCVCVCEVRFYFSH